MRHNVFPRRADLFSPQRSLDQEASVPLNGFDDGLNGTALALILSAAFIHAGWNLLAKQAGGGAAFVWLFSCFSSVIYAPVVIVVLAVQKPNVGLIEFGFLFGTAALHTLYYLFLQRGYRAGDLSLVYPLARSTGPLLATVAAIVLLGERPSPMALAGGGLILLGVVVLTWGTGRRSTSAMRVAVSYGLITGVFIATYTVWDKYAVHTLKIPPLLVDYSSNIGRVLLLLPFGIRHWNQVQTEWRTNRRAVVGIGVLGPLSYILILTAMSFAPVSYVAPAREISILIGAFIGARLLGEGQSIRRLIAAATMVLGFAALAFG